MQSVALQPPRFNREVVGMPQEKRGGENWIHPNSEFHPLHHLHPACQKLSANLTPTEHHWQQSCKLLNWKTIWGDDPISLFNPCQFLLLCNLCTYLTPALLGGLMWCLTWAHLLWFLQGMYCSNTQGSCAAGSRMHPGLMTSPVPTDLCDNTTHVCSFWHLPICRNQTSKTSQASCLTAARVWGPIW